MTASSNAMPSTRIRPDGIARAVGDSHSSALDRHRYQRRAVEHELQKREKNYRSERPIEENDNRTREFGRKHRTRRESTPEMILGSHEQE